MNILKSDSKLNKSAYSQDFSCLLLHYDQHSWNLDQNLQWTLKYVNNDANTLRQSRELNTTIQVSSQIIVPQIQQVF